MDKPELTFKSGGLDVRLSHYTGEATATMHRPTETRTRFFPETEDNGDGLGPREEFHVIELKKGTADVVLFLSAEGLGELIETLTRAAAGGGVKVVVET